MRQALKDKKIKIKQIAVSGIFFVSLFMVSGISSVSAVSPSPNAVDNQTSTNTSRDNGGVKYCGDGESKVKISFDIGCRGEGGGIQNPITDAVFAIIRFLTLGVGLIIVGSVVVAGIQYTSSRGDPQATAAAITRIKSNVTAFLIYVFSFALLNYVIPRGFIG